MEVYKGWIPTVAGRLSFSIIGDVSHPTRPVKCNISDEKNRFIITFQKRVKLDGTVPFKALVYRHIFRREGDIKYVCIGKCSDIPSDGDDKLEGFVFMFAEKIIWKNHVYDKLKEIQNQLSSYDKSTDGDLIGYANEKYKNIKEHLKEYASFFCEYSISRQGELILFPASPSPNNAYWIPPHDSENEHNLYSQIYFYLKDIIHHHQHHKPHTDTVLDVFRCSMEDDYEWRCSVIRSLLRKIVQFKRHTRSEVLASSRGTLAYANAFRDIERNNEKAKKELKPKYNSETLLMSIESSESKHRLQEVSRAGKMETFRSLSLTFIGLIVSTAALLSLPKGLNFSPHPFLLKIGEVFVEDTVKTFSVLIVLYVFSMTFFYKNNLDWVSRTFVRAIIKIIQPYKRKYIVFLLSAVACFLLFEMIILILQHQ